MYKDRFLTKIVWLMGLRKQVGSQDLELWAGNSCASKLISPTLDARIPVLRSAAFAAVFRIAAAKSVVSESLSFPFHHRRSFQQKCWSFVNGVGSVRSPEFVMPAVLSCNSILLTVSICFVGIPCSLCSASPIVSDSPDESSLVVPDGDQPDGNHPDVDQPIRPSKKDADVSARSPRRPMTSIRLGDSINPVDDDGKPLETPDASGEADARTVPVQHHFVPAPWHPSHASRNTFPLRYQPLYFEDPNMERCGNSAGCLTEATSIVHFATRIPLLPLMMTAQPPCRCVKALPDCPTCSEFGCEAYVPTPFFRSLEF
jgi:hypothetical protein